MSAPRIVPAQCRRPCYWWQRRGGLVLPAQRQCCLLEVEGIGSVAAGAIVGLLAIAAETDRCPGFMPMPNLPDSYLSKDIES